MQLAKCVACGWTILYHFLLTFFIHDLGFCILGTSVGSTSFVELFVVETLHENLGTIFTLLMLIDPHATFTMFLLCDL